MKGFVKEQYAAKARKQLEVLKAQVKKLRAQLRSAREKLVKRPKSAGQQPPR